MWMGIFVAGPSFGCLPAHHTPDEVESAFYIKRHHFGRTLSIAQMWPPPANADYRLENQHS